MTLTIIAAVAANGIIGMDNKMPWHVAEDFAHFKRITLGHTVVMGRKTFDSLGRPLPKRRNVVISRSEQTYEGAEASTDLLGTLQEFASTDEEVFLIGGSELWAFALEQGLIKSMILSHMKFDAEGDTSFPQFNKELWVSTLVDDYDDFTVKRYDLLG